MSSRESSDSASQSGKHYPSGGASAPANPNQLNLVITKNAGQSTSSLLGKNGGFNGHAVEVWADGAVWDTVSNKYLQPGVDFNPGDVQRF